MLSYIKQNLQRDLAFKPSLSRIPSRISCRVGFPVASNSLTSSREPPEDSEAACRRRFAASVQGKQGKSEAGYLLFFGTWGYFFLNESNCVCIQNNLMMMMMMMMMRMMMRMMIISIANHSHSLLFSSA